ncbi:MAG: hypothetical protein ACUVXD_16070 [Thermodesulfobacteriota bacterium]
MRPVPASIGCLSSALLSALVSSMGQGLLLFNRHGHNFACPAARDLTPGIDRAPGIDLEWRGRWSLHPKKRRGEMLTKKALLLAILSAVLLFASVVAALDYK